MTKHVGLRLEQTHLDRLTDLVEKMGTNRSAILRLLIDNCPYNGPQDKIKVQRGPKLSVAYRLGTEHAQKLREISQKTGMSQSEIVRRMLEGAKITAPRLTLAGRKVQ